jgi:SAM-dependent methyltransferase
MRIFGRRQNPRRLSVEPSAGSLTSTWFDEAALRGLNARYSTFEMPPIGYATVRDFADSLDYLNPLATAQGDLKDAQRPWMLKAILGSAPSGSRVLEIGAGQPYVADILSRLGYEVWLVDPYDGSGNGPIEFEQFRAACPDIRFVRAEFSDELDIPAGDFDCVYSISVLEHIDEQGLDAVARGMRRALAPTGHSIHAVDHVLRGNGDLEHLQRLRYLTNRVGIAGSELDNTLSSLSADTETYFLSAESHNRWRGSTPYDEFPMRVCVSVHLASTATDVGLVAPNGAFEQSVRLPEGR